MIITVEIRLLLLIYCLFVGALAPEPGRHLPECGGIPDKPSLFFEFSIGSGKPFPRYGGALLVQDFLGAMEEEPEVLLRTSGAGLHVLTCANGVDQDTGVPWPESACRSDVSNFVGAFDLGPRRPCLGPDDVMRFFFFFLIKCRSINGIAYCNT